MGSVWRWGGSNLGTLLEGPFTEKGVEKTQANPSIRSIRPYITPIYNYLGGSSLVISG